MTNSLNHEAFVVTAMDTRLVLPVILLYLISCTSGKVNNTYDETIKQRVHFFTEHCPRTRTCSKSVRLLNVSYFEDEGPNSDPHMQQLRPCCQSCNCSDDCGLNCCPDRSGRLKTEEELYNARGVVRCVRKSEHDGYNMVADCPYRYSSPGVIEKCRRGYSEYNFDVPLRYILPVYDSLSDLTYKNIYCAQCHNVELSNIEFASFDISCPDGAETNLTYIRDIKLGYADDCYILFEPYKGTLCSSSFVDRCNVTGLWNVYDQELEESCLSYKSVYNENYRNIHCFLCNGYHESDILHVCRTASHVPNERHFISIIEFYPTVIKHGPLNPFVGQNAGCHPNPIYNSGERSNWTLHCPFGMPLGGNCLHSSYIPTYLACFEISLMLEPQSRDKNTLREILSNLTMEIEGKIKELTSGELREIKGFFLFTQKFENGKGINTSIDFLSVRYVALQISIHVNARQKVGNLLDITLVFTKLLNYGNFVAKFRQFNTESFRMQRRQNECFEYQSLNFFGVCTNSFSKNDRLNFHIFQNDTSKLKCSNSITYHVEPEPFCPRVILPKLHFADDVAHCNESRYLTNILTGTFLSLALTENETHLFFCHEDYFQQLTNPDRDVDHIKNKKLPPTNEGQLTIMYLTIGVLSLSLISLILALVIYSMFVDLRTLPGLNNMALVSSLIVFQTMCLVNTCTYIDTEWLCSFFGAVTHFSLICSFGWMFICTFHMMKIFIKIRNRAFARTECRTFVIYTICSTGVAIFAVVSTITIAQIRSEGRDMGYGGFGCYIKDPITILFTVAIPVAIVVVLNFCMFFVVVFKISRHPNMASSRASERANIIIFAKLSTVTGMTWIFGFVFVFTKIETFAYLFIVLNAGQGVFIMLSFVCNRRVLNLIRRNRGQGRATPKQTPSTNL